MSTIAEHLGVLYLLRKRGDGFGRQMGIFIFTHLDELIDVFGASLEDFAEAKLGPLPPEIASKQSELLAAQVEVKRLRGVMRLWGIAVDNSEECEYDDMAHFVIPMPLFCDADEAMKEALATPPDLSALSLHDAELEDKTTRAVRPHLH